MRYENENEEIEDDDEAEDEHDRSAQKPVYSRCQQG
jgi:hypothetical protein